MRISTEELAQHLAREPGPLYTVFGREPLLLFEAGDLIRARARAAGYAEREVLTVDAGFRWGELALAGRSLSLFASKKLLELRIPGGKPGIEGSAALEAYCKSPPVATITLISLQEVDWRAQKSGWFEALSRAGVVVEAKTVPRRALPQWIAGRLQAQDQDADPETLDFIADRVEGNLMAAYQEVQKLALLFPPGRIAFEQVRDAVLDVARYDVSNLGPALLEGDVPRLARMLEGLRGEGAAPPLVLWAMCEEIRAIGKVVSGFAAGRPPALLWREAKVWGAEHQSLMQQHARRFSIAQVTEALRHAAAIDRLSKGLARGDVWDELLQLALRFARSAPANPAAKRGKMAAARAREAARNHPALF
jgi:DNA polymerase III subunit delta